MCNSSETQTKRRQNSLWGGRNFWTKFTRYHVQTSDILFDVQIYLYTYMYTQTHNREARGKEILQYKYNVWKLKVFFLQVIETVEPGLTQRRGISLFERFLSSYICVGVITSTDNILKRFYLHTISFIFSLILCHSRSACHLQLGRDLYDRKKFGKEVLKLKKGIQQSYWSLVIFVFCCSPSKMMRCWRFGQ